MDPVPEAADERTTPGEVPPAGRAIPLHNVKSPARAASEAHSQPKETAPPPVLEPLAVTVAREKARADALRRKAELEVETEAMEQEEIVMREEGEKMAAQLEAQRVKMAAQLEAQREEMAAQLEAKIMASAELRRERALEFRSVTERVRLIESGAAFETKKEPAGPSGASDRKASPTFSERLRSLKEDDGGSEKAKATLPEIITAMLQNDREDRALFREELLAARRQTQREQDPTCLGEHDPSNSENHIYQRRTTAKGVRMGNRIPDPPELQEMKKDTHVKPRLARLARYDRMLKFWFEGRYESGGDMYTSARRLAANLADKYVKCHKDLVARTNLNFTAASWSDEWIYVEDNSFLAQAIPSIVPRLPECVQKAYEAGMIDAAAAPDFDLQGFHRLVCILYEIRVLFGPQDPDDYEKLAKGLEEINSEIRNSHGKEWADILDKWWLLIHEVKALFPHSIVWKRVGKSVFKVYENIAGVLTTQNLLRFHDAYEKVAQRCDEDTVYEGEVLPLANILRGYCRRSVDVRLYERTAKDNAAPRTLPPPFALAAVEKTKGTPKGKGKGDRDKDKKGRNAHLADGDAETEEATQETPEPSDANAAKGKKGGGKGKTGGGGGKDEKDKKGAGDAVRKVDKPCFNIRDEGTCRFGDKCRFSHEPPK